MSLAQDLSLESSRCLSFGELGLGCKEDAGGFFPEPGTTVEPTNGRACTIDGIVAHRLIVPSAMMFTSLLLPLRIFGIMLAMGVRSRILGSIILQSSRCKRVKILKML